MSQDAGHLTGDLAQFYLVVDLVLELFTGQRHAPPRIRIEFLAEEGFKPRRNEETWPTLIIELKENITRGSPAEFMVDFDRKVAEHVMRGRRPDRLAFYIHEPEPRVGKRNRKSYWMVAAKTVGDFPLERAVRHTKSQYPDRVR